MVAWGPGQSPCSEQLDQSQTMLPTHDWIYPYPTWAIWGQDMGWIGLGMLTQAQIITRLDYSCVARLGSGHPLLPLLDHLCSVKSGLGCTPPLPSHIVAGLVLDLACPTHWIRLHGLNTVALACGEKRLGTTVIDNPKYKRQPLPQSTMYVRG